MDLGILERTKLLKELRKELGDVKVSESELQKMIEDAKRKTVSSAVSKN